MQVLVTAPSPQRGCQSFRILPALSLALAGMGLAACAPEFPSPRLSIQVVAAAPVTGAQVLMWWVDEDGHPLRRDGQRSSSAALMVANALADGETDEQGFVELETGPAYGLIVLVARRGQTTDPWLDAESGEDEPTRIDLAMELTSVLVDFFPGGPQPRHAVISPLTTIAAELGERRLAYPNTERTYLEAMRLPMSCSADIWATSS